jgi:hypothetical protein
VLEHLCARFYVIGRPMQAIVWCALPAEHDGVCADRDGKWETRPQALRDEPPDKPNRQGRS